MADKNQKQKTMMKMVGEGQILKEYGKSTFISVSPKPDIDKIEVQIIEQDTAGKDYVNFWLTTSQMYNLCRDIQSGRFVQKCAKDVNDQYPSAYKYVCGAEGSKKLNIGGGQKGIRFNLSNPKNDKSVFKNCAISIESLNTMAELFLIIYGFKPSAYFMKNIADTFWNYNSQSSKHYSYNEEDDSPSTQQEADAKTSDSKMNEATTTAAATQTTENNKVEDKASSTNSSDVEVKTVTIFAIKDTFKDYKNGKSFDAYECVNGNPGSKKLTVMLVNGDTQLTDDEYNDFRKFANEQEDGVSKVSINYYVKNGNCYMKSFA